MGHVHQNVDVASVGYVSACGNYLEQLHEVLLVLGLVVQNLLEELANVLVLVGFTSIVLQ